MTPRKGPRRLLSGDTPCQSVSAQVSSASVEREKMHARAMSASRAHGSETQPTQPPSWLTVGGRRRLSGPSTTYGRFVCEKTSGRSSKESWVSVPRDAEDSVLVALTNDQLLPSVPAGKSGVHSSLQVQQEVFRG